ncbi:MAG TPA: hypothetical protein VM617_06860 [Thermoanaerobaculia bacterium]|nr:hypothetical protein [Thermoanaerobaculia bacterium]
MKKPLALALLLPVALAAAVAAGCWRHEAPQWTSESSAALAELEAGHEAMQKLYFSDASDHFGRALEHDPDLVVAKLRVVQLGRSPAAPPQRIAELIEEVRAADLDTLTPRESLLVRYFLARIDRELERAKTAVDAYLAEHPDDPYAIELVCGVAFAAGDLDEAERCNRRLIELDPNRVGAQNTLGYLAMARGDFAGAEERFTVYRYVAPDQANPHDSLGELYLLTGRYDEAVAEFESAVAAKSDFCPSWQNLVLAELLRDDFAAAETRLAEARRANGCGDRTLTLIACRIDLWRSKVSGEPGAVLERGNECRGESVELLVISAWAAWTAGHADEAAAIEEQLKPYGDQEPSARASVEHLAGVRLLHTGDPAAAAERFRAADRQLLFHSQQWLFKQFNRRALAVALAAAGEGDAAAAVRAEISAVDPHLLDHAIFSLEGHPTR